MLLHAGERRLLATCSCRAEALPRARRSCCRSTGRCRASSRATETRLSRRCRQQWQPAAVPPRCSCPSSSSRCCSSAAAVLQRPGAQVWVEVHAAPAQAQTCWRHYKMHGLMAVLVRCRRGTKPRWSCSCQTTLPKCTSTSTSAPCAVLPLLCNLLCSQPVQTPPSEHMAATVAMHELASLAWSTRAVLAEVALLSCNCILCSTPFKIHGDDTLLKLMDLSVKPSPLAPLGSRPASGKRRRSSPAPLGPHHTVPALKSHLLNGDEMRYSRVQTPYLHDLLSFTPC